MIVGVPREDVGKDVDAGQVLVFTDQWSTWTQDTKSPVAVPGSTQPGDRFGASVAQMPSCDGDPEHEAFVVGSPNETVGPRTSQTPRT